ncbi:hypothetical protein AGMMS50293_31050 [Spirochaetia bacterium]|nr:hypothetical protein AGMMS50293_31050 [Spirochaetia bacterium]
MNRKKITIVCALLLGVTLGIFGADFGLALNAEPKYGSAVSPEGCSFTGTATPWISGLVRTGLSYYVSGEIIIDYQDDKDTFPPVFTLGRTELRWRPTSAVFLTLGRQRFQDSTGLAVAGLFDGLSGSVAFPRVRLGAALFYTGLLYKEQAEILMTPNDGSNYAKALNYGDTDSYFASRRVVAALTGEFPDLSSRTSLALNAIAQFDVNEGAEKLHSQYLAGQYVFTPVEPLRLHLAFVASLKETETQLQQGYAAAAGADWELPSLVQDMVSVQVRWSSGAVNEQVGTFTPVNGISQGEIFTPRLPALMTAHASYTVRVHQTVSLGAGAAYFIRTDLETVADADIDPASQSRSLGAEVSGSAVWAPDSALRLSAGGGVFLPGSAFVADTPVRWKIRAGVLFAF